MSQAFVLGLRQRSDGLLYGLSVGRTLCSYVDSFAVFRKHERLRGYVQDVTKVSQPLGRCVPSKRIQRQLKLYCSTECVVGRGIVRSDEGEFVLDVIAL